MDRSKTCLLIDDDPDDQEIFMIALKNCGAAVECFTSDNAFLGLEFLDKNQHATPDYIFLDLNMPGMSGKQCLAAIKKRPFLENVPVVIYTTSFQQSDISETLALGAEEFITKPASIITLTKILSDFFEKHG